MGIISGQSNVIGGWRNPKRISRRRPTNTSYYAPAVGTDTQREAVPLGCLRCLKM